MPFLMLWNYFELDYIKYFLRKLKIPRNIKMFNIYSFDATVPKNELFRVELNGYSFKKNTEFLIRSFCLFCVLIVNIMFIWAEIWNRPPKNSSNLVLIFVPFFYLNEKFFQPKDSSQKFFGFKTPYFSILI